LQGNWVNISTSIPGNSIRPAIKALAVLASNTSIVYAAIDKPYVAKSTDGGQTWALVNPSPILGVSSQWDIQIDPSNPNLLYLATSGGIYKSTNAGVNWVRSSQGLPSRTTFAVTMDANIPTTLYAGTSGGGIYRSINGGASWLPLNGSDNLLVDKSIYSITIKPGDPTTIVLGGSELESATTKAVYKTTDSGLTWVASDTGIPAGFQRIYDITIDPLNPNWCYAALRVGGGYASSDGCTNWSKLTALLPSRVYVIRVDPSNSNVLIAATSAGIRKSTNAGLAWAKAQTGLPSVPNAFALQWPTTNLLILGSFSPNFGTTPYQIATSTNSAVNWSPSPTFTAPLGLQVWSLLLSQPDSLFAGFYQTFGLLNTTNHGATWETFNNPVITQTTVFNIVSAADNPNVLFLAIDGQGMLKSTDGGQIWVEKNSGLDPVYNMSALAIAATNPDILYVSDLQGTNGGIYQSLDGGDNWAILPFFAGKNASAILIDRLNPAIVYLAQLDGNIYKSIDGGANWSNILVVSASSVALSQSPVDNNIIYVVSNDGVQRSQNGGTTWSTLNNGLPAGLVSASHAPLLVSPDNPKRLYVGFQNGTGVYQSVDSGLNWTAMNTGLNDYLLSLIIDPANPTTFYAGTNFLGVFEFVPA